LTGSFTGTGTLVTASMVAPEKSDFVVVVRASSRCPNRDLPAERAHLIRSL